MDWQLLGSSSLPSTDKHIANLHDRFHCDRADTGRAEKRNKAKKERRRTLLARATPRQELKRSKQAVRCIADNDIHPEQQPWFKAGRRQWITRLDDNGVIGHQPCMNATVYMRKGGGIEVGKAVIKQRI